MDSSSARRMAESLRGQPFADWTVGAYLGHGGSAVVVEGLGSPRAALKIFDPTIVERHGEQIEQVRITRELSLRQLSHPHLVHILNGGSRGDYLYIAMEYVTGRPLSSTLPDFPREQIRPVVAQIASAAQFLESNGYVHRDIKAANVIVSDDFKQATLLDFGVVRPLWDAEITESHEFLGTKRYAPPEFLYRTAGDATEDWRAITYYQLGALLHDLIMRAPLYGEYSNEAQLIDAVKTVVPRITNTEVEPELIALAGNCLLKTPADRLRFVGWDSFSIESRGTTTVDLARQRILARGAVTARGFVNSRQADGDRLQQQTVEDVTVRIASALRDIARDRSVFPAFTVQPRSASPLVLSIQFDASPRHALVAPFEVTFQVDIVDYDARAVEITSVESLESESGETHVRRESVFRGTLEPATLRAALELVLITALDQAQNQDQDRGTS